MRRLHWWVILLGAIGVIGIGLLSPPRAGAASRGGSGQGRATPTPPALVTGTATGTPTATVTPVERCGRFGCAIITPAPMTTTVQATPTATPPAGPAPTTITVTCDWTALTTWVPCLLAAAENMVNGWLNDIDSALNLLNIWSSTAPGLTYDNPTVIHYWTVMVLIAGAFLLLVLAGLSVEILLCARLGQTYSGALERFWRLLLVVAWVAASRAVIGQAIDLSNDALAVLDAAQQQPLFDLSQQGHLAHAVLLEGLLWIVDGVMEILLLLVMLMRLALLDVLIVLAPLGLLCYGWPRLQGWAQVWSRLFGATLLTQLIQIAALRLGEDLVTNGAAVLVSGHTVSSDVRTLLQFLVGIAVFVVVLRIPRLLNNHGGQAVTPLALALWAARTVATGGAGGAAQPPLAAAGGSTTSAPPSAPAAIPAVAVPPAPPPAAGTGRAP